MTTYRFQEVKYPITKRIPCRTCGKKFARSTTLYQTINPFNKNADGQPKTYPEIWKELRVEAEAWQPDDLCGKCKHAEEDQ
jgi:hypothetical protein